MATNSPHHVGGPEPTPNFAPTQGANAIGPQPGWVPPVGSKGDKFLTALADFGFTKYVTPTVLKVLYALGIVVIVANLLLSTISAGFNPTNSFGADFGITSSDSFTSGVFGLDTSEGECLGTTQRYSTDEPSELDPFTDTYRLCPEEHSGFSFSDMGIQFVQSLIEGFIDLLILRITLEVCAAVVNTARAWQNIQRRAQQRGAGSVA